jgi:hypothetical protein
LLSWIGFKDPTLPIGGKARMRCPSHWLVKFDGGGSVAVATFFVRTGGMEKQVESETAYDAGVEGVRQIAQSPECKTLGTVTIVTTKQGSELHDDDLICLTQFLLEAAGFEFVAETSG